ncbi:MAG: DUF3291 domain-containing protein [Haliscomenobacter sp.]|uniref:DUF3291 domain-containing protein n=1 Tax=Haliscomenobacter sp. TaxID=2717303 RepID=UPI0029A432A0|nr:DUF3291 domain-containing protein [Haliscomenobacter sp.]MDX2066928.1 DUF3291 domain-containing protein [Haliscomenobacter sp.]
MSKHLAQINIGRLLAPIDDPLITDFVRQLDDINALAESSPGFVWRLKDDTSNDATSINVFGDPLIIVNMSVWESIEDLKYFAYKSAHVQVFRDRARWFEKMDVAHMALWWVPVGTMPTAEEGRDRLLFLREKGESEWAFTFRSLGGR